MKTQILFSMDDISLPAEERSFITNMFIQWETIRTQDTFVLSPTSTIGNPIYSDVFKTKYVEGRMLVDAICEYELIPQIEVLLSKYNPTIIIVCDEFGLSVDNNINILEYKKFVPSGEVIHSFLGWNEKILQ